MSATALIGYYHEHGYNIWKMCSGRLLGDEPLYEAGNSPRESTTVVPVKVGEDLTTIQSYCQITGKELSEEMGLPWLGCDREDDPLNCLEEDPEQIV